MNWNNIDLTSSYERNQTFLDGYDFDTLILELTCNHKAEDITPELVLQHAIECMQNKYLDARDIVKKNAANIAQEVINYHKQD